MQLKEIRKSKNLSVPALAELSGVPRRTIQDLEARDDGRVSTMISSQTLSVSPLMNCAGKRRLNKLPFLLHEIRSHRHHKRQPVAASHKGGSFLTGAVCAV